MISRIILILLAIILLPDLYLHWRYLRRRKFYRSFGILLWWLPAACMAVFALSLAAGDDFAPEDASILRTFLLLFGLLVVPKAVFALCSLVGFVGCRLTRSHKNWGNMVGFFAAIGAVLVMVYGLTLGPRRLKVRQVEYRSAQLPAAFDGYRIALFSDLHLGTYGNDTQQVEQLVKTINEAKPDMIIFAGDLENMQPSELDNYQSLLSQLKAPDGVFSVLGNHDYPVYIKADMATEALNESLMKSKQRSMGWQLLLNSHATVRRASDSIVVAGMENQGRKPHPRKGDIEKSMEGVGKEAFVVMLQHDPTAWRETILPSCPAQPQLTLSGHTHGGQLRLLGWSPASLAYDEWHGLHQEADGRALYVTTGVGGLVPFRFGVPPEVVIITLRH